MTDALTEAINSPSGRLAEIVVKRLSISAGDEAIPAEISKRLDLLADAPGRAGQLARIRLAVDLPLLFARAPEWTARKMIPLFSWNSAEAGELWDARRYSRYIGQPDLFVLTKSAFLELFSRNDVGSDVLSTFAEWLTATQIANRSMKENPYPITALEARAALRRAGNKALRTVAHRLAREMELAKPEEKRDRWLTVVGPVFKDIWPLDIELQGRHTTFKLVQLLLATGEAFPEAADVLIPFIRPDEPQGPSTVFFIAGKAESLYQLAPEKMLDLVAAVVGDAPPGSVYMLGKALSQISAASPALATTRKFQKLLASAAGQ